MKLKPYPKYKPSGVEWLGDVPEQWEVKRLKTSAASWVSNVDKVPAEDELPVRLCNYTDVYYNDYITTDMSLMETTATSDEIRRFGLRVGDVVITKDSEDWRDIAVPALVKKATPDMVCGYHLAMIRSRPNLLFGDYVLRAFQSCAVNQQFQVAASGVTRYGLPKAAIGNAWIPLPDVSEQRCIAAFLDRETGRIDRLVAKKRELIARLKEKRTALISRTVTRGLPPAARAAGLPANPPLKPSGIDWLGEIPEHWEVKKLSWLFRYSKGPSAATLTKEYVAENGGDYPVFSGQTENNGLMGMIDWYEFDFTSPVIFVTTVGARAMTTRLVSGRFNLSQNCALIIPRSNNANPYFFEPVLRCLFDYERRSISLIMQPSLRFDDLDKFRVPLPPPKEQTAIADYLNAETAKLDALLAKVEEAIERLQEYRTALITAAVTGKIDVRESARPATILKGAHE